MKMKDLIMEKLEPDKYQSQWLKVEYDGEKTTKLTFHILGEEFVIIDHSIAFSFGRGEHVAEKIYNTILKELSKSDKSKFQQLLKNLYSGKLIKYFNK